MQRLILHPEARKEMFEAAAFYETSASGLGFEFLAEVEEAFDRIKGHPDMGQVLKQHYRRALLQRFPYGVIYRRQAHIGYVVAIMHLKRKPGYWLPRIAESRER